MSYHWRACKRISISNLIHQLLIPIKAETDMELLEKVLSKDNLNKSYKQVYKNKGTNWVTGVTIKKLFLYIKEHKEEIL